MEKGVDSPALAARGADVRVPITYVRALVRHVRAGRDGRGEGDVTAFLAGESLDEAALGRLADVPAERFGRLYRRAMDLLDDESLGMAAGGRTPRGTFRMMCLCLIGCTTLGEVIERVGEFVEITRGPRVKPVLASEGSRVRIEPGVVEHAEEVTLESLLDGDAPHELRTALYFWANFLGWFVARPLPLEEVRFAFAAPARGSDWSRLFRCPVRFDAQASALVLPRRALTLPVVQNAQTLTGFLRETPYRLVVPSFATPSLRERLRDLLAPTPGESPPTAREAAAVLGLSLGTLRRRLAEEGVGWQALKDESRHEAARRYLADTDLPLSEIATLLGFDEPSAFFRAFRRWSGETPSDFRRARASPFDSRGDHGTRSRR